MRSDVEFRAPSTNPTVRACLRARMTETVLMDVPYVMHSCSSFPCTIPPETVVVHTEVVLFCTDSHCDSYADDEHDAVVPLKIYRGSDY